MKLKEITATIKITDDMGNVVGNIEAKGNYKEPESLQEILDTNKDEAEIVRVYNYGLNTIEAGKLRSQNNLAPVAKKLVEAKLFKSHKEAFEHLMSLKNAQRG